jgi:protein AFG1
MAEYRDSEYSPEGPMAEYNARVKAGKLRDDEHQRMLIESLQDLHNRLVNYTPPKVIPPSL